MGLECSAEFLHWRLVDIVHQHHGMGIAERDCAELNRAIADVDPVAWRFALCHERDFRRVEPRYSHIHGD